MKKIYERIVDIKGNLLSIIAKGARLGELAKIEKQDGTTTFASVLSIEEEKVTLQAFQDTRGISTGDKISFLGRQVKAITGPDLLGRRLNGMCDPMDAGPKVTGREIDIGQPSFNPVKRVVPHQLVRTNIPMIDLFNCLVKSQKIPIFSTPGEPYNELLMRIANQTNADIVIIGGMGLRYDDYLAFIDNAEKSGSLEKTIMFSHLATDPPIECLLVPDMALAVAEDFAAKDKDVLVLLTDMTAFADAMKEILISMDQIPSNRGYPGSLYSDLASRYEKAVDIDGSGSITIISVTTMPGGDITHPIPDNTGYITEGQFYLTGGKIDPFGSLSRLKQQVIGIVTREDHGEVANTLIRLYADSKKSKERQGMGFKLSKWDEKLIQFALLFEEKLMNLRVNIPLEESINLGWKILSQCFTTEEVGMKKTFIDKYWPSEGK